jgi:hypothetical protein
VITIETQPQSPPRLWRLSPRRKGQWAVIESDHLVLTTPDKEADRMHRLPLKKITRIYIAWERRAYEIPIILALIILGILMMPLWGPGHLNGYYHSWLAPMIAAPIAIITAYNLYLSLLPKTLIYLVAAPQPWGVRVRLRRRKLDEFIDALSAGIVRCQSLAQGGVKHDLTPSGDESGEQYTPPA